MQREKVWMLKVNTPHLFSHLLGFRGKKNTITLY